MPGGSNMPGVATCSEGAACPGQQHAQGEAACPGGAECQGKQHAHGEQHNRALYIASLYEIEDNFVSGFEFERQLMLIPSGNAAAPWACCSPCGRAVVGPICFKAGSSCPSSFKVQKKVTVWGGKISSQNCIERLLISSPPSKRTLNKRKIIFLVHFCNSRFQMNFSWEQLSSKLAPCW